MQLMILRHGQAENFAVSDDARNLTKVGRAQAAAMGAKLAEFAVPPTVIAHSPLVRTTQTANIVQQRLNAEQLEIWPELVHQGSPEAVEQKLMASGFENVLLVTHMPLIAIFEHYLLSGDKYGGSPFNPCELAVLNSDDAYPGNWQLIKRVKPSV